MLALLLHDALPALDCAALTAVVPLLKGPALPASGLVFELRLVVLGVLLVGPLVRSGDHGALWLHDLNNQRCQ